MALVLKDRVQEVSTTSGTGTLTLSGAVAGFQTFSTAIGNGNTTFYTIFDNTAYVWEVGIGTVGAGTLARTTVLSNSSGNTSPINLAGNSVFVWCDYPSEKSVNLDASGNVTPLGTIASGTWQGTTVGVSYGGTGVTASSGANSVVLRDANQNIQVNSVTQNLTSTVSAGGTTTLTPASPHFQILTGTTTQTFKLPDATSLVVGSAWIFDNDSTGNLYVTDNANGPIDTVAPGGYTTVFLETNGTVAGEWGKFGMIPSEVNWGTNSLDLGGSTLITNGTWNGTTIGTAYGGTGLTSFSAANYALYSTSSSALTAGTLPVAAGGSGAVTFTANGVVYGDGTNPLGVTAAGTTGQVLLANTGSAPTWGSVPSTGAVTSFQTSLSGLTPSTATTGAVTLAGTLGVGSGGTGTSTAFTTGSVVFAGASGVYSQDNANLFWDDTNNRLGIGTASPQRTLDISSTAQVISVFRSSNAGGSRLRLLDLNNVEADGLEIFSGTTLSGITSGSAVTLKALNFNTGGSERMRIDSSGNVGIGTASPTQKLQVAGNISQTGSGYLAQTDGTNTVYFQLNPFSVANSFGSASGQSIPFIVGNSNTERMRITANGGLSFGVSGTAYGTSGQILQSNGDAAPTWVTPASSGLTVGTTSITSGTSGYILYNNAGTLGNLNVSGSGNVVLATSPTVSGVTLNDGYTEEVFPIPTSTAPALSPTNGSIQTWTLTGTSAPTAGTWAAGQSLTLMIDDGTTAFTISWASTTFGPSGVNWVGGLAPTLATTGWTVVELWKVGSQVYGALVGNVAA
jgi:hypothetical protein